MQKNEGASPSGNPIATPSRKVPGVKRSFFVLSCHSSRKAISVPLWSDRTVKARALGSGQTGLVMICPLNGSVIGETLAQAASSGHAGSSPSIRRARIIIPSELTRGTPNPTKTPATTRIERNRRSNGREEIFVVLRTMQDPRVTARADRDGLRLPYRPSEANPTTGKLLPEFHAANFVFAPFADVEIALGVQRESDRRIDDGLHAEESVAMFHCS